MWPKHTARNTQQSFHLEKMPHFVFRSHHPDPTSRTPKLRFFHGTPPQPPLEFHSRRGHCAQSFQTRRLACSITRWEPPPSQEASRLHLLLSGPPSPPPVPGGQAYMTMSTGRGLCPHCHTRPAPCPSLSFRAETQPAPSLTSHPWDLTLPAPTVPQLCTQAWQLLTHRPGWRDRVWGPLGLLAGWGWGWGTRRRVGRTGASCSPWGMLGSEAFHPHLQSTKSRVFFPRISI